MEKKAKILILMLAIVVLAILIFAGLPYWAGQREAAREEKNKSACLERFDVEKEDLTRLKNKDSLKYLDDYFVCKNFIEENYDGCSNLTDKNQILNCQEGLFYKIYFPEIISNKKITQKSLDIFNKYVKDKTSEADGSTFGRAFLDKDLSFCKKMPDDRAACSAMIGRDLKYCDSIANLADKEVCKDAFDYIKAVESRDKSKCGRIGGYNLRLACQVFFEPNLEICRQNANFISFKNIYCESAR